MFLPIFLKSPYSAPKVIGFEAQYCRFEAQYCRILCEFEIVQYQKY
jgi:hypothetical protein